ncbi:AbrB/MazE/SpoVT family DNA-binding domain-containing protein [Lichenicoccus roseus]|uniref:AbrB/MazE/SpoVT family DNA-binding domain-containing protein n=1 Tax=Lichenicoccus roseus TaxID=2683649 RepID=A0A5R9J167_9PROT|nr:AbrB/MazE/SpoVT family DNA-binding domain-containing protein [Lichenicoccus roseus]TLU70593.1 AbrB/MazE/SpoVT family DNA-binding domain-containing protein [Lichenicoccus roseus]
MLDGDQWEATIGPDGALWIPATLLEKMRWKGGTVLIAEITDDGILLVEAGSAGDIRA